MQAAPVNDVSISSLFSVAGKNVLVTGGGRGIGVMISKGFVDNGATVYISSRSAKVNEEMAAELSSSEAARRTGGKCVALPPIDLSGGVAPSEKLVEDLRQAGVEKLHVLINNSGIAWGEPLESFQEVGWDRVLNVNLKSIFYLTRACLPLLKAAASGADPARIINVASIAGIRPQIFPTYSYDCSKAAVIHLTKKFASEFATDHITVNAIAPGMVPSKMSKQLLTYADEEMIKQMVPLGRLGNTADMAGLCIFLASKASAWITGDTIIVDGGNLLVTPISKL
eukprot:TRINITY_DN15373_c0_g1_i1.p1 TRINITY_DN15373_c0_g1~~TRINITY_DN15373_c0_g1_i1.p1  ORF type:complete len:310 (+),score=134.86 TRINITY_DN15373_c0_g1_i1:84-932(+)